MSPAEASSNERRFDLQLFPDSCDEVDSRFQKVVNDAMLSSGRIINSGSKSSSISRSNSNNNNNNNINTSSSGGNKRNFTGRVDAMDTSRSGDSSTISNISGRGSNRGSGSSIRGSVNGRDTNRGSGRGSGTGAGGSPFKSTQQR